MAQIEQITSEAEPHQSEELFVKQGPASDITQTLPGFCTFKILLAEQCDFNRHLLKTFLRCQGYTVVTAQDGLEALQRFYYDSVPFDLVVVDIDIPGINGNILARHIHNMNAAIPVLALTDSTTMIGEHFDGAIAKPLQLSELLDIVEGSLPHP
jgi:CheY-like chemotaxis protein